MDKKRLLVRGRKGTGSGLGAVALLVVSLLAPAGQLEEVVVPVIDKSVSFEANGTRIPAIVSLPEGRTPDWGIVIVPGSFNNDVDGNFLPEMGNPFTARTHVYKDLATGLAARGVAALRYAKGGTTVVDPAEAAAHKRFADRTNVVEAAAAALRRAVPGLKHLALAGHSEGGPVCLQFLTRNRGAAIDAYVSLSAPGRRFFDIMLQQTAATVRDGKASFGPLSFSFEAYTKAMALVRAGEPVPPELLKQLPPMGVYAMDEASRRYLREYDEVDSARLIAGIDVPVLIVQGGSDTSVYPDNAEILRKAGEGRSKPVETALFPGLQHFYKALPPGLDPAAAFGLETESDSRVAEAISAWLRRQGR